LAAEGRSTWWIARALDTMPRTVSLWRGRFRREGLSGLSDKPRPGSVPKYTAETGKHILAVLDRPPPVDGKSLHGASFTSVKELREHIDAFIESYNQNVRPFVWTKAKVHQRRFEGCRISELWIPSTRSSEPLVGL
jgi:transposase